MGHIANISFSLVFLTLAASAQAQDQERKLSQKALPAAVLSAFKQAYPNATIKGVAEEKKAGKTYFEIESKDGKTFRDLLYQADGSVAEIEESLAVLDLPAAVRTAVQAKYPKAKLHKAEKVTKGAVVTYDVEVRTAKGKVDVDVDSNGKLLKETPVSAKEK